MSGSQKKKSTFKNNLQNSEQLLLLLSSNRHHVDSGMGQAGDKLRLMKTRVVMIMTGRASGRTGDSEYQAFGKLEVLVTEDLEAKLSICHMV